MSLECWRARDIGVGDAACLLNDFIAVGLVQRCDRALDLAGRRIDRRHDFIAIGLSVAEDAGGHPQQAASDHQVLSELFAEGSRRGECQGKQRLQLGGSEILIEEDSRGGGLWREL